MHSVCCLHGLNRIKKEDVACNKKSLKIFSLRSMRLGGDRTVGDEGGRPKAKQHTAA